MGIVLWTILARKKLKKTEGEIEKTIYSRWIKLSIEFATFKNKWTEALYNISTKKLKEKRNIPEKRALGFDSIIITFWGFSRDFK